MAEYQAGALVRSLAGHDKDDYFLIIKEEADYVYLADGKLRTVSKPKRKKKKHVQLSKLRAEALAERLEQGGTVRDEEIKYFLTGIAQGGKSSVESRCNRD